ncbi:hypothetical protein PIIN_08636 [Serendipita indica DSM 11827]|uniref:DUF6533 domain-containing protein n=1 Tax=Serendipita indica (strain DSM 11827) TaxID=1109443 RepID=G4TTP2_SERID|nr:hypothetical protein PIIN_08636 [Serendipita indica DSM 11827]
MTTTLSPEQQAGLNALGVTLEQFQFYHARRIDGRYLTQSMATLLLYDFLLTFADEVRYVWQTKPAFSVAKVLWFLNRYWPLASVFVRIWAMAYARPTQAAYVNLKETNRPIEHHTVAVLPFNSPPGAAWSINIAIVDVLLMLRVWALYNGSRKVMWILIAIFAIGLPSAIAIRGVPPLPTIPLVTPAPRSLTVCKRSPPSELFSLFTMALAIDTVIFAMVIVKAWGKKFRSQTPVLTVLIRDGALYYAAITAVLVFMITATMVPVLYQPVADANLNIPLCSLACNRLILSLRGVYFKAANAQQTTIPTMDLTSRPRMVNNNTTRDIQLDHLASPRSANPFIGRYKGEDEYDWVPSSTATAATTTEREGVVDISSGGHARRHSIGRTQASVKWRPAQVTVTQTQTVFGDDGVDLAVHLPAEDLAAVGNTPNQSEPLAHSGGKSAYHQHQQSKGLDWWDMRSENDSRSPTEHSMLSRGGSTGNGAYRTVRQDRIDEEHEGDSPRQHTGRAL